ncbi:Hpr(Ser) kinase/phosphatase [Methylophilus rhizosphaerae]|uniref:HPr kinase/phosphorylase n=1 Tax=Methylophilus rhizosphaerae TaxID=492660 RepID=A0A1G9E104_9PROT|nr:HPr(Ser) kinase/phosphatase [Methylophilus rhizosphaerae]SDK69750.1 Hpr(Ser) kinase/phosphatase [Methylophilus rhizosphaerae]
MAQISVADLYKQIRGKLKLKWVAGESGGKKILNSGTVTKPSLALVGHLNFVHPNRVQVLGCAEMDYLRSMSILALQQAVSSLFSTDLAMVVVANGEKVPPAMLEAAQQNETPLFTTPMISPQLMELLSHYLAVATAETTSLHGVFMEVQGFGVLITGSAAIGKSELALELISRGHRLVADDIVDFYRTSPERIEGRCPELLQDFLEVRGLGILNIRALYGDNAVKPTKPLDMMIQLELANEMKPQDLDRLSANRQTERVLDVEVSKVIIPIAAGRNIAVLVEAAVRNHMLLLRGVNATKQLTKRQKQIMLRESKLS